MADQDFKYVIQDLTNVYMGAGYTYEEMLEDDNIPHKLKEVIVRILLTEVAPRYHPGKPHFLHDSRQRLLQGLQENEGPL